MKFIKEKSEKTTQLTKLRKQYLIALGTNLGNRKENLGQAISKIRALPSEIEAIASPYENRPVGFESSGYFWNSACIISNGLEPSQMIRKLLHIEAEMGRNRYGADSLDRIIDLDIILARDYDGYLFIEEKELRIPHPRAHERDFVIVPCAEIAPEWNFEGYGSIRELLAGFPTAHQDLTKIPI